MKRKVTMNSASPLNDDILYGAGDLFNIDGAPAMLCQVSAGLYKLICQETGNRYGGELLANQWPVPEKSRWSEAEVNEAFSDGYPKEPVRPLRAGSTVTLEVLGK